MTILTSPDFLVLAAAFTYVLGYLVINQVMLRTIILVGTVLYIGYYATAADEPLWMAIWTSVAVLVANCIGLSLLISSRYRIALPRDFVDVYDDFQVFRELPPGDFNVLMRYARRYSLDQAKVLTEEGKPVHSLYFVLNGKMEVEKLGRHFIMPSGIFVGEVAYILGRTSSATTVLQPGAEVIEWPIDQLKSASERKARFKLAIDALVSKDLAQKVSLAVPNAFAMETIPSALAK
jgi:hypothetical protein